MKRTLNLTKSNNKFVEFNQSFTNYTTRFLYDSTINYQMEVLDRTEKTAKIVVTLVTEEYHPYIEFKTKKINIDDNGVEFIIFDDGIVFRADRVAA